MYCQMFSAVEIRSVCGQNVQYEFIDDIFEADYKSFIFDSYSCIMRIVLFMNNRKSAKISYLLHLRKNDLEVIMIIIKEIIPLNFRYCKEDLQQ